MKMDSKSGATLAAAAATLFLAGAVVSTGSTLPTPRRQVHGRQRLQGPERLQGRRNACKGHERLQGQGFSMTSEARARPRAASSSRADRAVN